MGIARDIVSALTGATITDLKTEAEQPQDVSASRSGSTWETNTTGYPMVVYVGVARSAGAANRAKGTYHINTTQSDNEVFTLESQASDSANASVQEVSGTMIVPPGHNYKVDNDIGFIAQWNESKLGVA